MISRRHKSTCRTATPETTSYVEYLTFELRSTRLFYGTEVAIKEAVNVHWPDMDGFEDQFERKDFVYIVDRGLIAPQSEAYFFKHEGQ